MLYIKYYTRWIMGFFLLIAPGYGFVRSYAQTVESSMPAPGGPFGQQITISMESYAYTPAEVRVDKGQPLTLTLSNQSFLVPHNFLLDDPHGNRLVELDISSGDVQAVSLTLNETGMYSFYCDKKFLFFPSHRKQGMEGHLYVR